MAASTVSGPLQDLGIGSDVEQTAFPAPTKNAAGSVNGIQTDVSSIYFADKILITISQSGRLSQWVCHSLSTLTSAV